MLACAKTRAARRIGEIAARRERLTTARGLVQAWEDARAEENRFAQAIDTTHAAENRISALRGELSPARAGAGPSSRRCIC